MTKTRFFAPLAAAALLAAGAAPAFAKSQDSQSSSVVSASASAGKSERTTCRRYQNSESRLKSERLCLTKTQWKKFENEY